MSAYSPDSFQAIPVLSVPVLSVSVLSVMTFILPTVTESFPAGTERPAARLESYSVTSAPAEEPRCQGGHNGQPSRSFRDQVRGPGRQQEVLRPALRLDLPGRGHTGLQLRRDRHRGSDPGRDQPAAGRRAAGHVLRRGRRRSWHAGGGGGGGRPGRAARHAGPRRDLRPARRPAGPGRRGRLPGGLRTTRRTRAPPGHQPRLSRRGTQMPGSPPEAELLSQAAAGDQAAFAVLIEPHRRAMFRHCYRMLGSGADAEDATQDALVRAWRGLAGFDGSGAFGGWLHRIATNVCLDLLRGQQRRLDPLAEGPPAGPGAALAGGGPGRRFVEPVSDVDLAGPAV